MSRRNKLWKVAKSVVAPFVNAFVPEYENKSKDIYNYGKNNNLPNQLISFVADSGVATRSAKKFAEYIASDGFVNEAAAKLQVNGRQTADQLLQEQALYMALLSGAAFHVKRTGGKVTSVEAIPVQCVRKKLSGGFLVNETYGQPKLENSKDVHIAEFVPRDLTLNEIADPKYKNGELLYVYVKTPYNQQYPVPDYYAQIEDVRTSGELAKMDLELTLNGFMPSAIVTVCGEIDDTTKDENGNTEADYYREEFKKFTGQEKNTENLAGRFKGMLTFARTKDEATTIQTLDIKAILDSSNEKRDVVERAVCRLWGIHPVLMGYSEASVLGNQQALANAATELNKVVNPYQRLLSEAFKLMFPAYEWTISEYMPISYVPDKLLQDMTQDERRQKFLGLPPLQQTNTNGTN